ncbi:hypothetical protein HYW68_00345 [Candidatus Parcubacteria bacterium]|nr:hypothetical protein [Candidatus Parcubacteria bacterium]
MTNENGESSSNVKIQILDALARLACSNTKIILRASRELGERRVEKLTCEL